MLLLFHSSSRKHTARILVLRATILVRIFAMFDPTLIFRLLFTVLAPLKLIIHTLLSQLPYPQDIGQLFECQSETCSQT